jgi:hypothetical protein
MYYAVNPDALAEIADAVELLGSTPTAAERRAACC